MLRVGRLGLWWIAWIARPIWSGHSCWLTDRVGAVARLRGIPRLLRIRLGSWIDRSTGSRVATILGWRGVCAVGCRRVLLTTAIDRNVLSKDSAQDLDKGDQV